MRFRAAVPLVFSVFLAALFQASASRADARDEVSAEALEMAALSGDADVSGEALFRLAEIDEANGRYARALARYEAMVARAPSSRYVPRASARASVLRSHAEGDFVPFGRLEEVRTNPKRADDPREIDALAREADAFPPGLVRVEARMLVAEACLGRLGRPDDAIATLRKIVDDPKADPLTARHAARMLVDTLVAKGDLEGAIEVTRALGGPAADPALAKHVTTLQRRRAAHRSAVADVGVLALLAGASLAGAARRRALAPVAVAVTRSLPIALAFAAYVALAGGALASGYESGNAAPFLALGAVLLPLVLVARAWGAAASMSPGARTVRAVVCASAAVAGGFLVLEALDTAYLASFGL